MIGSGRTGEKATASTPWLYYTRGGIPAIPTAIEEGEKNMSTYL
jgi:hypothetical protein